MTAFIWSANLLGWPVIHLVTASIILRLPLQSFSRDSFLYRSRSWEQGGEFYRKRLAIHRWKAFLPDGAPWVGGFAKKQLAHRDRDYIGRYLLETRRAEFAHWCMLLCLPIFFLWNPLWACVVMTAYAAVANVPCILAQRYNRHVLARLLNKMKERSQSGSVHSRVFNARLTQHGTIHRTRTEREGDQANHAP